MPKIILIAHNVRSAHNAGAILRTSDGLGINRVFLTGYTPYPSVKTDKRLPHVARRAERQIAKTALGAEKSVSWEHREDVFQLAAELKSDGFLIAALELGPKAKNLNRFKASDNIALIVGSEVKGIEPKLLGLTDVQLQIPMNGQKESLNVAAAAAIALYHLRYFA